MILNIVEGDVIIPSPAWIGYAPKASLLDKPWHVLPLSSENDYRLQPEELDTFLRSLPQKQHLLGVVVSFSGAWLLSPACSSSFCSQRQ